MINTHNQIYKKRSPKIGWVKYFPTLNLASSCHQIELDPKVVAKTTFTVDGWPFEFVMMLSALTNAPADF